MVTLLNHWVSLINILKKHSSVVTWGTCTYYYVSHIHSYCSCNVVASRGVSRGGSLGGSSTLLALRLSLQKYFTVVLYSRKLSRVKTFLNFAVSSPSAKVFFANFCVGGPVTIFNRQSPESFLCQMLYSNSRKFSPARASGYMVLSSAIIHLYRCVA